MRWACPLGSPLRRPRPLRPFFAKASKGKPFLYAIVGTRASYPIGARRESVVFYALSRSFFLPFSKLLIVAGKSSARGERYILRRANGEVAEWSKAPVSKTGILTRYRGFESLPLRREYLLSDDPSASILSHSFDSGIKQKVRTCKGFELFAFVEAILRWSPLLSGL